MLLSFEDAHTPSFPCLTLYELRQWQLGMFCLNLFAFSALVSLHFLGGGGDEPMRPALE